MERTIEVNIRWWHDESDEVNPNHIEQLHKHAEEHICEMKKDDYTSGELNCELEGIHYNGWWNIVIR